MMWKMRDDREIPVTDMSCDHLRNAIAMMRRRILELADEPVDEPVDVALERASQLLYDLEAEQTRRRDAGLEIW